MRKLIVIGILLFCGSLCHGDWWISVIDSSVEGMGSSVAVDSSGIPRVAYCIDTHWKGKSYYHLRYVWWNSVDSVWEVELRDSSNLDSSHSPRLKLDSRGLPHIIAYGGYGGRHIHQDTNHVWHIEPTEDEQGVCSYSSSFDFDSEGRVHIVCPKVRPWWEVVFVHCYRDSLGWHSEPIDSMSSTQENCDCKVDCIIGDDDIIHTVYEWPVGAQGDKRLVYAKRVDGKWHTERIGLVPPGLFDLYPSIALDTCGAVCVAFARWYGYGDTTQLRFAERTPTGWQIEVVESTDWFPDYSYISDASLCIGQNNHPRISYIVRCESGGLKYAWLGDTGWESTILDKNVCGIGRVVDHIDMVVDSDNVSHISYGHQVKELQKYARGHGFFGVEDKSDPVQDARCRVHVSPNPFTCFAEVSGNAGAQGIVPLQVYDMTGRLLQQTQSRVIGKNLTPGVYFVRTKDSRPTKVVKLR